MVSDVSDEWELVWELRRKPEAWHMLRIEGKELLIRWVSSQCTVIIITVIISGSVIVSGSSQDPDPSRSRSCLGGKLKKTSACSSSDHSSP